MMFIPISKEERDYMNETGNIPDSVVRKTDGCTLGLYTPEQKKKIEEQRNREQLKQMKLLLDESVEQSRYRLAILRDSLDFHLK